MIQDSEVCNFADDNTTYAFDDNIETILRLLKGDINNALQLFKCNQMAANPEKFQVIFMGLEKGQRMSLGISGISIKTTVEVKPLGITIDSKLQYKALAKRCQHLSQQMPTLLGIVGHCWTWGGQTNPTLVPNIYLLITPTPALIWGPAY